MDETPEVAEICSVEDYVKFTKETVQK